MRPASGARNCTRVSVPGKESIRVSAKTQFPNLLLYPSMRAFKTENPNFKFSTAAYYRELTRQKKEAIEKVENAEKNARSILKKEAEDIDTKSALTANDAIERMVALAKTQNIPLKSLLPVDEVMGTTHHALQSIKRHMVTQWQCAAFWLERVHPEIFAKRDAAPNAAAVIGIRLEVCQREVKAIPQATEATVIETKEIQQIIAENA